MADWASFFRAFLVMLLFLPLGIWKLVELILWAWARVHWGAP